MRSRKNVRAIILGIMLVGGMVSCENWMIQKLLERNEPSGGGGNGGAVERVEITNGTERGGGVGSALVIKTEVYPASATNREVEWRSSDLSVADVVGTANGATVHLLKEGHVEITVKPANGGKETVCVITVIPAGSVVDVKGVQVYPPSLLLGMGESSMLMAQVLPGHATDHGMEWKSSDESVVSVDNNGIVRAVKAGSEPITITARSASDSSKSGSCRVTVNPDRLIPIEGGTVLKDYKWAAASGNTASDFSDKNETTALGNISVGAFYIGETEVRYELWYKVREWGKGYGYTFENEGQSGSSGTPGAKPTTDDEKNQPVTKVGWRDVVVWCNAYSEMRGKGAVYRNKTTNVVLRDSTEKLTGSNVEDLVDDDKTKIALYDGYRLPTEAEWEYAARGGKPGGAGTPWAYHYAGTDGTDVDAELGDFAWYGNASGTTHSVGGKQPNTAGLYDMSGNVQEWCFDSCFTGNTRRVIRGGGWSNIVWLCSVAGRSFNLLSPSSASNNLGFRVVCR